MHVPGDWNILLISVCDLCYRKKMLMPGNLLCKIDLKDVYFTIFLARKYQKYARF